MQFSSARQVLDISRKLMYKESTAMLCVTRLDRGWRFFVADGHVAMACDLAPQAVSDFNSREVLTPMPVIQAAQTVVFDGEGYRDESGRRLGYASEPSKEYLDRLKSFCLIWHAAQGKAQRAGVPLSALSSNADEAVYLKITSGAGASYRGTMSSVSEGGVVTLETGEPLLFESPDKVDFEGVLTGLPLSCVAKAFQPSPFEEVSFFQMKSPGETQITPKSDKSVRLHWGGPGHMWVEADPSLSVIFSNRLGPKFIVRRPDDLKKGEPVMLTDQKAPEAPKKARSKKQTDPGASAIPEAKTPVDPSPPEAKTPETSAIPEAKTPETSAIPEAKTPVDPSPPEAKTPETPMPEFDADTLMAEIFAIQQAAREINTRLSDLHKKTRKFFKDGKTVDKLRAEAESSQAQVEALKARVKELTPKAEQFDRMAHMFGSKK